MVSTTTNTFVIYQILSFKQETDYYELGVKYLADDNKDISTFINNENLKFNLFQEDKEVVKDIQDSKDLPVSQVSRIHRIYRIHWFPRLPRDSMGLSRFPRIPRLSRRYN